jgi:hypothetical protein
MEIIFSNFWFGYLIGIVLGIIAVLGFMFSLIWISGGLE